MSWPTAPSSPRPRPPPPCAIRDGETLVTDGPFVEAKEALGGYFLLECDSIEDAVDWAARIPGAEDGAIEVRPCYLDESEEAVA